MRTGYGVASGRAGKPSTEACEATIRNGVCALGMPPVSPKLKAS